MEKGDSNVSQNRTLEEIRGHEINNLHSHLQEDILSYMVFHGDSRPKLSGNVVKHDLVLITYATLVADCKGSKVL